MAVTRDDVMHIAALARLAIDEQRVPELVDQLNAILGHMDVLQRVETHGAATTAPGLEHMPLADDAGPAIPLHHPLQSIAPEMRDGFFLVPRLATHDDAESGA